MRKGEEQVGEKGRECQGENQKVREGENMGLGEYIYTSSHSSLQPTCMGLYLDTSFVKNMYSCSKIKLFTHCYLYS